jgi:pilus assembly protein FimV
MRRRAKDDFEEVELEEQEFHTEISSAPLQDSAENIEEDTTSLMAYAGSDKTAAELIEQADMFIGYADYVQAETSLNQARLREPDNQQAITKSLFVLYKQQQADAFSALVEESNIDKNGSDWKDIKAWGLELMPNNALFHDDLIAEQDVNIESETSEALNEEKELTAEADEFEAVEDDATISLNLDDYATDSDEAETQVSSERQNDDVLEFDLGESLASESELSVDAVETEARDNIDFDLDAFSATEADELELDTDNTVSFDLEQVEQADEDRLEIDLSEFDLGEERDNELTESAVDNLSIDLDETSSSEHDDLAEFSIDTNLSADLSSMEFEALPDDAEEVEELDLGNDNIHEIDEAETKLDLAAAYIDMDDQEGAIGILKEVLADGNEEQQKRAQDLLNSIS